MPTLELLVNTYGTLDEATAYLDGSARATEWPILAPDDQLRALISAFRTLEKLRYAGSPTGVEFVSSVAIVSGGTGMTVGTELVAVGGTGTALTLEVEAVSAGVATAVSITNAGGYTDPPTGTVTFTGGGGDFTATIGVETQDSAFPRSGLVSKDGAALSSTAIPRALKEAQFELANEISADTSLEAQPSTGKNIRTVKAGSVAVEFFRPTAGTNLETPIPTVAFDLIRFLLSGAAGASSSGSLAYGTGQSSSFDECDRYRYTQGLS